MSPDLNSVQSVDNQLVGSEKKQASEEESSKPLLFPDTTLQPDEIIGRCPAMGEVSRLITVVAPSKLTVLLRGQMGTGKKLVAGLIHQKSLYCYGPFVAIDHETLNALMENNLGVDEKTPPINILTTIIENFKVTQNGTLFIDDIAELTPGAQGWLLHAIQDDSFQQSAGITSPPVHLRIIAASNRDLENDVAAGRFKEDLFYRINGFTIVIPPLRKRGDDLFLLAHHFVKEYSRFYRKTIDRISRPAIDLLASYHWPGNVRELKTVLKYGVLAAEGNELMTNDLSIAFNQGGPGPKEPVPRGTFKRLVAIYKKELVTKALNDTHGNLMEAVKLLKTTPRIIGNLVHQFNIDYREYRQMRRPERLHGKERFPEIDD